MVQVNDPLFPSAPNLLVGLLILVTKRLHYGRRRRSPWSKVFKYSDTLKANRHVNMYDLGLRMPEANNQVGCTTLFRTATVKSHFLKVFFIDTSGALCSRSSGHAIDVEGE